MRILAPALLWCAASCSGMPRGDRAEDFLPFKEPWTGLFKCGDKEPQKVVVRSSAPKGQVWLIDVSGFYSGGQYALLITSGDRGILLHNTIVAGALAKVDPPQILLPRNLADKGGWTSSGSDVRIVGSPELAEVPALGRRGPGRQLEVRAKVRSKEAIFTFWMSPGVGIIRYRVGEGDLRGDWELAEVLRESK
jgi:hypothetical protein